MKYYLLIFYLMSVFNIYGQQEVYLDALYNALFPYNTDKEKGIVLGVVEMTPNIEYTMIGRKNRPDIMTAYKYLTLLRQSDDVESLSTIKQFRSKYDSLFQIERMIPFKGIKIPFNSLSPEYRFYNEFDIAIYCLETKVLLANKNEEEQFEYITNALVETFDDRGQLMKPWSFITDNIDSFTLFAKSYIDKFFNDSKVNSELADFLISALGYSKVVGIDEYLIGISNNLSTKRNKNYYSCLGALSKISTNKALIHLLEQKKIDSSIPIFSYLRGVELTNREQAANRCIAYARNLDRAYPDYNFEIRTISRFRTSEVVDFFIREAKKNKNPKKSLFESELYKMLDSEIDQIQKNKIQNFFQKNQKR